MDHFPNEEHGYGIKNKFWKRDGETKISNSQMLSHRGLLINYLWFIINLSIMVLYYSIFYYVNMKSCYVLVLCII